MCICIHSGNNIYIASALSCHLTSGINTTEIDGVNLTAISSGDRLYRGGLFCRLNCGFNVYCSNLFYLGAEICVSVHILVYTKISAVQKHGIYFTVQDSVSKLCQTCVFLSLYFCTKLAVQMCYSAICILTVK